MIFNTKYPERTITQAKLRDSFARKLSVLKSMEENPHNNLRKLAKIKIFQLQHKILKLARRSYKTFLD